MAVCSICNKGKMAGRHVRHIHTGLWERKAPAKPRTFAPNIQKRKVQITRWNGKTHQTVLEQVKICAKCLKRITRFPGWRGYRLPLRSSSASS